MRSLLKLFPVMVVIITLGACASVERLAIPDNTLIDAKLAQNGQRDEVHHAWWDQFLHDYTQKDDQNVVRVNYAQVSEVGRKMLKSYIAELSKMDATTLTKNAQLAYWANLYNATTVNTILEHYPVESIRNIKGGVFDLGPWEDKRLIIDGRATSLHDIEHGIIRALWSDIAEIHYILNCAAAGCPNLAQEAYTADNVQSLMRKAAEDFVNDPLRGVIVQEDGRVVTSKIFTWYLGDYGGSHASVLSHIRTYANTDLKKALEDKNAIDGFVYDWSLNDTKNANTLKKPILAAAPHYN